MDKRFVFFLVFVSVTQNSVLPSLAVFDGFPQDIIDTLDGIADTYLVARRGAVRGFEAICTQLIKYNAESSHDSDNVADQFAPAITQIKTALSLTARATTVFGGEIYQNLSTKILDNAFSPIISTIELVKNGQNTANSRKLRDNRFKSLTNIKATVDVIFTIVQNYTYQTNKNAEDLIDSIWIDVSSDISNSVNATHDVLALLDPSLTVSALTAAIEPYRLTVIESIISAFQKIYSLYETLYMDNYLGHGRLLDTIYSIQVSRKAVAYNMAEIIRAHFDTVAIAVAKIGSTSDNSITITNTSDFTIDMTSAKLQETGDIFLHNVRSTQPASDVNVSVTATFLPEILKLYAEGLLTTLTTLNDNVTATCPTSARAIDAMENIENEEIKFIANILFPLVRNNDTTAAALEPRILNIQQTAIVHIQSANTYLFHALQTVDKVICSNGATAADALAEIQTNGPLAATIAARGVALLFYGNLVEVLANAGY